MDLKSFLAMICKIYYTWFSRSLHMIFYVHYTWCSMFTTHDINFFWSTTGFEPDTYTTQWLGGWVSGDGIKMFNLSHSWFWLHMISVMYYTWFLSCYTWFWFSNGIILKFKFQISTIKFFSKKNFTHFDYTWFSCYTTHDFCVWLPYTSTRDLK